MQKYQNNVISPTGLALANVSVLVKTFPAGIIATIFSDNGVTTTPNPLTTDANGAFAFYADDGHYSLVISGPNVQTLTLTDIVLADEIPGDNIAATTVHLTDVITVQQGTDLRAATIDQVRSAILSGGTALTVTQGGTGQNTLTAHGVLIGAGTNPIVQTTAGTAGKPLVSGGPTADPAFGSTLDTMTFTGTTTFDDPATFDDLVTPSPTIGIKGTATNNNAQAGSIGEYMESTSAAISIANGTPTSLTSLNLSAGDWEVGGSVSFTPPAGAQPQVFACSISTTTNLNAPRPFATVIQNTAGFANNGELAFPLTTRRFSFSAATTVFVVGQTGSSVSSNSTAVGYIWARRQR